MQQFDGTADEARRLAKAGVEVWSMIAQPYTPYWVSNLGRVWSYRRRRSQELKLNRLGGTVYPTVTLYSDGEKRPKTMTAHRLVLSTFDPHEEAAQLDVRHKNDDPNDVRLCNLTWGTRSENMLDLAQRRRDNRAPFYREAPARDGWQLPIERVVQWSLARLNENKLTYADIAELWDCGVDRVRSILHSGTYTEEAPEPKFVRRSPHQIDEIIALIQEGATRDEVNAALNETLTYQHFYYFQTKARRRQ